MAGVFASSKGDALGAFITWGIFGGERDFKVHLSHTIWAKDWEESTTQVHKTGIYRCNQTSDACKLACMIDRLWKSGSCFSHTSIYIKWKSIASKLTCRSLSILPYSKKHIFPDLHDLFSKKKADLQRAARRRIHMLKFFISAIWKRCHRSKCLSIFYSIALLE